MLYGIPYKGSKTKIVGNILARLPDGERFVDLFGGGFAMSHGALLSRKYKRVFYNELNPLLVDLIKKALNGDFNYNRFRPEFIDRETFHREKEKDGYVKYIWSFGNQGKEYMFSKDLEPFKKEAHNFVIFGKPTEHFRQIEKYVKSKDLHTRRLQFYGAVKKHIKRFDLEPLERLEQLERLQRLQRLERLQQLEQLQRLERLEQLERLEIHFGSYLDYEHKDGDVVYCDPPYEGTDDYGDGFDSKQFYEWVKTRDYPVYFSSYQGVEGFELIYAKQLRSSLGAGNSSINFECLYTNG